MSRGRAPAVHLGRLAGSVGRGLAAGLVGTAAMTASSTLESKWRDRKPSTNPARAASRVLGVAPIDDRGERRFNMLVHWGYGTAWGAVRGVLEGIGVHGVAGDVAHLAVVWGGEQVVLPATGVAQPATHWPAEEVAVDLWHHAVYAAATGLALRWLDR